MTANPIEALEARRFLSLTPLGPATDVPGEGSQEAHLAVAGNGNFIIARVTGGLSDSTHAVEVVRYSATGDQIGSVITVASGKSISSVSVSMDADGDAVVTYGNNGVYIARISKAGVIAQPVRLVDGGDPAVSMDSGGGYFLAWTAQDAPGLDQELRVQAFDVNGVSRAPAFDTLSVGDLNGMGHLQIDAESDGSAAVVAAFQTFEGAQDNVAYARVSSTGLLGSGSINSSGMNEADPAVAIAADGSFEIGYSAYDKVGGSGGDPVTLSILVQRFDPTGTTVGSPVVLWPASNDAAVPKDILHTPGGAVSLDAMPDGGFIAVYTRTIFEGVGLDITPTFVQRFDSSGNAESDGPLDLVTNAVAAEIGVDADGDAVVEYRPFVDGAPLRFMRVSTTRAFAFVQDGLLTVEGDAGDDTISVTTSGTNLVVTRGVDTLNFLSANINALIVDGNDGNDTITNDTGLKSTLRGGDGSDTIFGGPGIDRIHGGIGNDSLWGGGGPDKIFGEDGVDSCYGNGGNDRIEGGAQHDHIRGNAGHDILLGNGGNDQIYGGADADRIYGGPGVDEIWGEGGDDRLYGDDGFADTLHGGAGNDAFITLDGVADQLFGDGGHDTAVSDDKDILTSIEVKT